jgi:cytochrome c oxidase subunit II
MLESLGLFPPTASTLAPRVDHLFLFLVTVSGFFSVLIATLLIYYTVKYHRRSDREVPPQIKYNVPLEVAWTVIPLGLTMVMFGWGASVYIDINRSPDNAVQLYGIGKQWMWKLQHPEGQREINELHIPVGQPVRITLTSQDVIHSFFVPAFRTKQDVVPGRYVTTWFTATKPGKYHLFCAEYCGTKHSGMIGYVYVLQPKDFRDWLTAGAPEGSLASLGEKLFHQFGCANCHHFDGHGPAPNLQGLFGRTVQLQSGERVVADESYVRESILHPGAQIVNGFTNLMPTFAGQVDEEQLIQLIEYVKSLGPGVNPIPSTSGLGPENPDNAIGGPGSSSISGSKVEDR